MCHFVLNCRGSWAGNDSAALAHFSQQRRSNVRARPVQYRFAPSETRRCDVHTRVHEYVYAIWWPIVHDLTAADARKRRVVEVKKSVEQSAVRATARVWTGRQVSWS